MTNANLFNAILAMDAYNRGYSPSIQFGNLTNGESLTLGQQIGNTTIIQDSRIFVDENDNRLDSNIGFYALAYDVGGAGTIISYRGTDNFVNVPLFYETGSGGDVINGWLQGLGLETTQSEMAFAFYNQVASGGQGIDAVDPRTASIQTTGHSLGGGLAGIVAGAYGKSADIFDSMPYEIALSGTQGFAALADGNMPPVAAVNFKNQYYGANRQVWDTDISNIEAFSIASEVLSTPRLSHLSTPELVLSLDGDVSDTVLSAFDSVDLPASLVATEAVQRHSMPLLVIRLFAETNLADEDSWHNASDYFWPVLFDTSFAQSIGTGSVPGAASIGGKFDAILQQIIAYSAISDGVKPFGDTAIHALYDDASDLGVAITASGTDSKIEEYATEISQSFVQFAGQLALSKINQTDNQLIDETAGNLRFDPVNGNLLVVDFRDDLWAEINNDVPPTMIARQNLVGKIYADTNIEAEIEAEANTAFIEQVIFSTANASNGVLSEVPAPAFGGSDPQKLSLFMFGDGADDLRGSSTNDLIFFNDGDDTLRGSYGSDILHGGADTDTLNYETFTYGLNVDVSHVGTNVTKVGVGYTPFDTTNSRFLDEFFDDVAFDVEGLVLTGAQDRVQIDSLDVLMAGYTIETNGGDDILDLSEVTNSVIFDLSNMTAHGTNAGSNSGLDIDGFTHLIGGQAADYFADVTGTQTFEGGGSLDVVDYSGATNAIVYNYSDSLANSYAHSVETRAITESGWERDFVSNVEGVIGANGNDYFYGAEGVDGLFFNGGNHLTYIAATGEAYFGRDVVDFSGYSNNLNINIGSGGTDGLGATITLVGIEDIIGGDGDDTITGTSVANWIFGGNGNNTINAGGGDDHLVGSGSAFGGLGSDTYYAGNGNEFHTISDTDGANDRIYVYGNANFEDYESTYLASTGVEFIEGSDGFKFELAGLNLSFSQDLTQGDMELDGTAIADSLTGGSGNDLLVGFAEADTLNGGAGNDALYANDDTNSLLTDTDSDVLNGGQGSDFLYGSGGGDILHGGEGYDELIGHAGDQLFGDAGQDNLQTSGDGTMLDGGEGNDYLSASGENTTYVVSAGHDLILDEGGSSNLIIDLSETIIERSANDSLVINNLTGGSVTIQNHFGGNAIEQINGVDIATVLPNDITYKLAPIAQTYSGGDENNIYFASADGDQVFSGNGANSFVFSKNVAAREVTILSNLDNQVDTLYFTDITSLDELHLTFDYVSQTASIMTLHYGENKISIPNFLSPDLAQNYRVAIGDLESPEFHDFSEINHSITSNSGLILGDLSDFSPDDVIFASHIGIPNTTIDGQTGQDTIHGGTSNDTLIGGTGNDTLFGNRGHDELNGGEGDDTLDGGQGSDILNGDAGDDELDGGYGNDEIHGGAGLDKFIDSHGNDQYFIDAEDISLIAGSGDNVIDSDGADISQFIIDFSEYNSGTYDLHRDLSGSNLSDYVLKYSDGSITILDYNLLLLAPQITTASGTSASLSDLNIESRGDDNANLYSESTSLITQDDLIYGFGGDDAFSLTAGDDIVYGGAGNDNISKDAFSTATSGTLEAYGGEGNDNLQGGVGSDILDGGAGNDVLGGWAGNDDLKGGAGDDNYFFGIEHDPNFLPLSSGQDTIFDASGSADSIFLASTFSQSSLSVGTSGNDLILYHGGGSIIIQNHLDSSGTNQIEFVGLASGDALDLINREWYSSIFDGTSSGETLTGNQGDNTLNGLGGNDILDGGAGSDTLNGGAGDDAYLFDIGDGTNTINEESGFDTIELGAGITLGDITFTQVGLDLDIQIASGFVVTDFFSGDANKVVEQIRFDDGSTFDLTTLLPVTNNNDFFDATSAAEHHDGGAEGTDTVSYADSSGRVTVDLQNNTGAHNDAAGDTYTSIERVIGTNHGSDSLYGDAGDNTLLGLDGSDNLEGGAGADILDGGDNTDYVRYTRSDAGVDVDLNRATQIGGHAEGDTLINIEHFYGTGYDDTFRGNGTYNNVIARAGDDTLEGRGGSDRLYGGSGNDTFIYESGKQQFFEESSGIDRVEFASIWAPEDAYVTGDQIIFDAGLNQITFNDITLFEAFAFDGHADLTLQELINVSGGMPVIDNTPSADDDTLIGTSAAELLDGGAGTDTASYAASTGRVTVDLDNNSGTHNDAAGDTYASVENVIGSQNGNDYLYGDANTNHLQALDGNDYLEGGAGADLLDGGDGTDFARYIRSDAAVTVDLIQNVQTGGHAEGDQLVNIEHLYGTAYDDTFRGNDSYNQIYGRNGNDMLDGRGGSDRLYGGNGDDILAGGAGVDLLYGQSGADTFVFKAIYEYSNSDNVQDFSVAEGDKIDISLMLEGYDPLTHAIEDFVQITDNGTNSYLSIDINGGADNFIQIATLFGETGLTDESALEADGTLITM